MAWVEAAAADLAEGTHAVRLADGRELVLVRRGSAWWALRDRCPHQGARLSAGRAAGRVPPCRPGDEVGWLEDEPVLVCPWHGWEFDMATGRCLTDAVRRVRAYPVRVESGRVWVEVDAGRGE